jgi:tetratricopeptide (TPR) repeat protein
MVHEWVSGKRTLVYFTPDSRALVISRENELTFWDVETMHLIRRLARDVAQFPGHVAFSPDGKLMAVEMVPAVIHLKEVATGRSVARLEDPHGDRASWQGFTPDGTRLVVVAKYARAIHLWDLRAIRTHLKEMNLDWDWPEFPPTTEPRFSLDNPPKVSVEGTEPHVWYLRGCAEHMLGRWDEAIAAFRKAIELDPQHAKAHNGLAWLLATCSDANFRDPTQAVAIAKKAVELAPKREGIANTLGVAHYQAGDWKAAIAALKTSMELCQGGDSYDWFFLAMAHWQLDEKDNAREWYDRAVQWTDKNQPTNEELRRFRAEAAELLGIEEKKN